MDISGGVRIIFRPHTDIFVQVMGAKNRGVTRQIIKIVHNDSNEQIQHLQKDNKKIKLNEEKKQKKYSTRKEQKNIKVTK